VSMRGASRRSSDTLDVSAEAFAWPHATIATLRHSTLPWFQSIAATPLADLKNAGVRDRLSLLGQYAAHAAMLQFAGIADAEFSPDEWRVVRKRGADCRLVRVAAARCDPDAAIAPMRNLQAFAAYIAAPRIDALQQSWTRAESVYAEVHRRIRDDAAADVRWLRSSAFAEIAAPGPEALEALWSNSGLYRAAKRAEVDVCRVYEKLDGSAHLAVVGTEFPIQPFSALASIDASLPGSKLKAAEVADRLVERFADGRYPLVVDGNLDEQSRRVVEILSRDGESVAGTSRWLVLSTRLAAQRAFEERLLRAGDARRAAEEFVGSDAYDTFLREGTLPVDDSAFAQTPEPSRSYIAALALLGTRIPRPLATAFLRQFMFERPLDELVVPAVTSVDHE